jgi:hypothetical protein
MTMCTILFKDLPEITAENITEIFDKHLPDHNVLDVKLGDGSSIENIVVKNGDLIFSIMILRYEYPQSDLKALMRFNYLLKSGESIINSQNQHIVISTLNTIEGNGAAIKMAVSTTYLAAVVSQFSDVLGVLWGSSGILQDVNQFNQSVNGVLQALKAQSDGGESGSYLPIPFWVGPRVYSPDGGKELFGCRTYGLKDFIGVDIDILATEVVALDQISLAMNISQYLIRTGSSIAPNETIEIQDKMYEVSASQTENLLNISEAGIE